MDKLWVCGKICKCIEDFRNEKREIFTAWEFCGIFDSEEKAIEECIDNNFFIFSSSLNKKILKKSHIAPDSYFPKAETKEEALIRCEKYSKYYNNLS